MDIADWWLKGFRGKTMALYSKRMSFRNVGPCLGRNIGKAVTDPCPRCP